MQAEGTKKQAAETGEASFREFHGVRVPDPFRWLEHTEDARVQEWVRGQQAQTDAWLRDCAELTRNREFLDRNHPALAPDWSLSRGGREFYMQRRAGAAEPLLMVRDAQGAERVLVDPNPLGRIIGADNLSVSPGGRYVAYTLSGPGGVPVTMHLCDAATGRTVEQSACVTAMPMYAWHPQETGFFYTLFRALFDDDGSGDARQDGLYWHALNSERGNDWKNDPCIQPYHAQRGHICFAIAPENSAHLLVCTFHFSSGRSGAGICRLQDVDLNCHPEQSEGSHHGGRGTEDKIPHSVRNDKNKRLPPLAVIFDEIEGYNLYLGQVRGELYFHTCRDAPMGRIIAVDPEQPTAGHWRTVVPERELALARPERFGALGKTAVGRRGLLVSFVKDATNVLCHYGLDGRRGELIEPTVHCTIDSVSGRGSGFRIAAQSFLQPRVIYEYRTGETALREISSVPLPEVDAARYELRQEFYSSKDGTRVPMFLLHRRDLVRDGNTPTLLYAYGGFNQAISPEFSPEIALWLERGGIYALANIRGGGEYGEAWHQAGSGLNKQNCYDDFYAAAEYLIAQKYTSSKRLAARGLSNGGLLTAVATKQRPDLSAAVISEVPLCDMLWLDETTAGQSIGAEYGNPFESRAMFEFLRGYSPVHNVHAGSPPQMIVVAEHDGSAPPGQAYKYVAARQAAEGGRVPVLLRMISGEGHTGWKLPNTRRALAEEITFLRQAMGVARPLRQPNLADARVTLRDGVELSTNIWLPDAGKHAAVLLRTPYGNEAAEFERLGLQEYLDAGYAVVIQSVRGRGKSGGEFGFFFAEGKDGYDTIEWIAAQPWCNGKVAMDGGSYLGTAQWLAAREQPPHLTCIMPSVPAGDWFNEIPYMGGALQVDWAFSWLGMMGGIEFVFDASGDKNLQKYRPLKDAETMLGGKLPLYQEVLAHPTQDAWWQRLQFTAEDFAAIRIPVFTVTGWFDGDQAGSLHYWQGIQQHATNDAQLIVGPWEHAHCYLGGTGQIGEMEFGSASVLAIRRLRLEFLKRHLDGARAAAGPRVSTFIMGANRWRHDEQYPPQEMKVQPWFLRSGGKANSAAGDGGLGEHGAGGPPDRYNYDPLDPVPYRGGALDHGDLEQRSDVLVYSSPVLTEPVTVLGAVELVLHASSSALDTDFTAKLLDVQPDGRALSLTHVGGVIRARYRKGHEHAELLTPGEPAEFRIRLGHTGHSFLPGHRIRLEVSSSCFPMIDPNANTGADFATDTQTQIAQQTVYHDAQRPSRLLLPVLPEGQG